MCRFAAKASLFLVAIMLSNLALFLFASEYQTSYLAAYYDKHRLLATTPSPRIIFVGGSNLAYGLDSEQVERRLHLPVVNMGLHSGLGLQFMLDEVRGSVGAGDIVVLSPEYQLFSATYNPPTMRQLLDVAPTAARYKRDQILPVVWSGLAYPRVLPLLAERIRAHFMTPSEKQRETGDPYLRASFDRYGDDIRHLERQGLPAPAIDALARRLLPTGEQTGRSIAAMNAFAADARARGAQTLFLFPPLVEAMYWINAAQISSIEQRMHRDLTFPILAPPEEYLFPATYAFDGPYHLLRQGRDLRTQQVIADLRRTLGGVVESGPDELGSTMQLFPLPVRMYMHAPTRHTVGFADLRATNGGETRRVASAELQPWGTDADRVVAGDASAPDGTRTLALDVSGSATDPWMASVNLPLTDETLFSVQLTTNTGESPAMAERVALAAEVRGPDGEVALFTSPPARTQAEPQTLAWGDLSRRAADYARMRHWRAGSLTVSRIGLELGWQAPLSQVRTDVGVVIETGDRAMPTGPDTYERLAGDAQRWLRAGDADGAVDADIAALLLRPDDRDGQRALGETLRAAERWREGVGLYTALLRDHPDDPWLRYGLATMQHGGGDLEGARATLAPLGMLTAQIAHRDGPTATRAHITATQRPSATPGGAPTVTLDYDTGDGSSGEAYVSIDGAPERFVIAGPVGRGDLPTFPAPVHLAYRLFAGADHTTVLDSVTIAYTYADPAQLIPWVTLLRGRIASEQELRVTRRLRER